MKGDLFTCYHCGKTEAKNCSNDQLNQEYEKLLKILETSREKEKCVIVCDECWRKNMPQDIIEELDCASTSKEGK